MRTKKASKPRGDKALSYTQWWIKYPWHVSGGGPYPKNRLGNCACKCAYCRKRGAHAATLEAHLKS